MTSFRSFSLFYFRSFAVRYYLAAGLYSFILFYKIFKTIHIVHNYTYILSPFFTTLFQEF